MTDSEYVLALDGTIGLSNSSLLIKAHRERLRSIAARLATHPLAAADLQQEAGEPVAWQFSASFWSRYESIPETLRADARPLYATPQVSPPQARVPLTNLKIADCATDIEPYPMELVCVPSEQMLAFATNLQRACAEAWGVTLAEDNRIGLETKE